MRKRTVVGIRVVQLDRSDSEMCVVTSDGRRRAVRSLTSSHATIDHAARRLAQHYGLTASGDGTWGSAPTMASTSLGTVA